MKHLLFAIVILSATANSYADRWFSPDSRGAFVNGSFEKDYESWNAMGNQEIVTAPTYQVTDGRRAVLFKAGQTEPNAVLSQGFFTKPGFTYTLTFDIGTTAYFSTDEQRLQVEVYNSGGFPHLHLNITTSIFARGTGTWYESRQYTFVADDYLTTLYFADVSPTTYNIDLLLDNVRIIKR
jgi:hypothetical protein